MMRLLCHYIRVLLGQRINQHKVKVWLSSTGWHGGPYGTGEHIGINFEKFADYVPGNIRAAGPHV